MLYIIICIVWAMIIGVLVYDLILGDMEETVALFTIALCALMGAVLISYY